MSLEPKIWGPHYWATFHFMAATYDDNPNLSVQKAMKTFIQTIPVILPCKECQDHAFNFIKESNLDKAISNRKELFTFFFNFHNKVNERLNKPLMNFNDALTRYFYYPQQNSYNLHLIVLILIILAIVCLCKVKL
jgi:hypothetical protein